MDKFTRENRLQESAIKIRKPFKIDPTLCIYSPQENVDSLNHPKIKSWQRFIQNEWTPSPIPKGFKRLALIIPCTKYKPYITSREHKAINAALLAARILGISNENVDKMLVSYRKELEQKTIDSN